MDALVTLARHQPGVVSKDLLVDEVWGGRATADESIVQCIKGIRQALDKDDPRDPKYVETIHGRGYRLMVPLKIPQPEAPESSRMQIPHTWWIAGAAAILVLAYIWIQRDETISTDAGIESVVVTRFVNMSGEEFQFLADGFAEQLISTLHQIPDLQIKKGSLPAEDESAEEITEHYSVGSVVRGSVQHLAGQVKISARIEDSDDVNLWAGTFNGTVEDMFSLHEQVATKVRDAIVGETGQTVTASSKPSGSVSYLRYLLGQSFLAIRDKNSLDRATELFLESIEIDPGYGPAYLGLANTYMLLDDYVSGYAMFDLAIATVEEGVRQDSQIHDAAQTVNGYVYTKRGNWMAATEAFEIAINSTVEYPPSQHYYSRLMAAVGRVDKSFEAAKTAWEMDPNDPVLNSRLAIACFWKNDIDCVRRYFEIANTMGLDAPIHQLSYALFLIRDSRLDEAREVARRAMTLYQIDASWVDPVFDELARSPKSATSIAVLQEYSAREVIPETALVIFWILAGQADRAMEMTWKLVDDPSFFEIELIYLDEFRILRQHEDFPRFLQEVGLTDYWRSAGCNWDNDAVNCDST